MNVAEYILCISNIILHLVGSSRIHSTVNEACGHQGGMKNEKDLQNIESSRNTT